MMSFFIPLRLAAAMASTCLGFHRRPFEQLPLNVPFRDSLFAGQHAIRL